jgi:HK97 gp10 family phage protein
MARDYIRTQSTIEGMDDLLVEMGQIDISVKGTLRKAVRAGATIIKNQAEANAKAVGSGKGKHARLLISARSKDILANIGPTKTKWWYRFLELGTAAGERVAGKGGAFVFEGRDGNMVVTSSIDHPGMAAKPWLRPAFDTKTTDATDAIGVELGRCIDERKEQLDNGPDEEE